MPYGGVEEVLNLTAEDVYGKPKRRPSPYRQKGPRTPKTPFREKEDDKAKPEKRRIRTRPRRIDYTETVQQLGECVKWEKEMVTLGKYKEPPHYDPHQRQTEVENVDPECLPDDYDIYKPFARDIDKIDFSILRTDKNDASREAKALRWTEENVPLRDEDLPIALRNPEIRAKTLREALGPGSKPKDLWKIWNMKEPTAKDIDPWIIEQYDKLPEVGGKKMDVIHLIAHPRTLRAAMKYVKIMHPSQVEGHHIPETFYQELSEKVLSGKWEPHGCTQDPPNPYRMEDYERVDVRLPKEDPDKVYE